MFTKYQIKRLEKKYPCLAEYRSAKDTLNQFFTDEQIAYKTMQTEQTTAAKNAYLEKHAQLNSIHTNFMTALDKMCSNVEEELRMKYFRLLDKAGL